MSKKTLRLRDEYDGKAETDVFLEGNYTVIVMTLGKNKAIGISKRNPNCDEYVLERGLDIAVSRALVNLDKKVHPARYKKAKK